MMKPTVHLSERDFPQRGRHRCIHILVFLAAACVAALGDFGCASAQETDLVEKRYDLSFLRAQSGEQELESAVQPGELPELTILKPRALETSPWKVQRICCFPRELSVDNVLRLIEPESWEDEFATIEFQGDSVVVRNSPPVHEMISAYLTELKSASEQIVEIEIELAVDGKALQRIHGLAHARGKWRTFTGTAKEFRINESISQAGEYPVVQCEPSSFAIGLSVFARPRVLRPGNRVFLELEITDLRETGEPIPWRGVANDLAHPRFAVRKFVTAFFPAADSLTPAGSFRGIGLDGVERSIAVSVRARLNGASEVPAGTSSGEAPANSASAEAGTAADQMVAAAFEVSALLESLVPYEHMQYDETIEQLIKSEVTPDAWQRPGVLLTVARCQFILVRAPVKVVAALKDWLNIQCAQFARNTEIDLSRLSDKRILPGDFTAHLIAATGREALVGCFEARNFVSGYSTTNGCTDNYCLPNATLTSAGSGTQLSIFPLVRRDDGRADLSLQVRQTRTTFDHNRTVLCSMDDLEKIREESYAATWAPYMIELPHQVAHEIEDRFTLNAGVETVIAADREEDNSGFPHVLSARVQHPAESAAQAALRRAAALPPEPELDESPPQLDGTAWFEVAIVRADAVASVIPGWAPGSSDRVLAGDLLEKALHADPHGWFRARRIHFQEANEFAPSGYRCQVGDLRVCCTGSFPVAQPESKACPIGRSLTAMLLPSPDLRQFSVELKFADSGPRAIIATRRTHLGEIELARERRDRLLTTVNTPLDRTCVVTAAPDDEGVEWVTLVKVSNLDRLNPPEAGPASEAGTSPRDDPNRPLRITLSLATITGDQDPVDARAATSAVPQEQIFLVGRLDEWIEFNFGVERDMVTGVENICGQSETRRVRLDALHMDIAHEGIQGGLRVERNESWEGWMLIGDIRRAGPLAEQRKRPIGILDPTHRGTLRNGRSLSYDAPTTVDVDLIDQDVQTIHVEQLVKPGEQVLLGEFTCTVPGGVCKLSAIVQLD